MTRRELFVLLAAPLLVRLGPRAPKAAVGSVRFRNDAAALEQWDAEARRWVTIPGTELLR